MAEVLSVTHYIQDVIEKTEAKARTVNTAHDIDYYKPSSFQKHHFQQVPKSAHTSESSSRVSSLVISRQDDEPVKNVLERKIALVKQIRKLHYSTDIRDTVAFLAPIVDNFNKCKKAYGVSLQEYKKRIAAGTQEYDEKVLLEIADKMIVAALFEVAIFRERRIFRSQLRHLEQALYDVSLKGGSENVFDSREYGLDLFAPDKVMLPNTYLSKLSEIHNNLNIWRFFFLRSWRSLSKHLTVVLAGYKKFMQTYRDSVLPILGPFFAYISWTFFIPRMTKNICTAIYAFIGSLPIFAHLQFPKLEREYGWYRRVKLRLKAIGAEIANDLMWIVTGVINCFALAGSLPIIGIYIMVAAQAYDFFVMMVRNYADRTTINTLREEVVELKATKNLDDSNYFLDNLNARIEFDKRVLLFAIFNFALLLMCISLMTPVFGSISPFIPLVAGLITVIVAPCRGYFLHHFKGQIKERFEFAHIKETNRGVVTLDEKDFNGHTLDIANYEDVAQYCKDRKLFGIYNEGLLQVKISSLGAPINKLYKYNKDAEPCLKPLDGYDLNMFNDRVGYTSQRVKSIDAETFIEYTGSNNNKNGTTVLGGLSSVISFNL